MFAFTIYILAGCICYDKQLVTPAFVSYVSMIAYWGEDGKGLGGQSELVQVGFFWENGPIGWSLPMLRFEFIDCRAFGSQWQLRSTFSATLIATKGAWVVPIRVRWQLGTRDDVGIVPYGYCVLLARVETIINSSFIFVERFWGRIFEKYVE